MRHDVEKAVSEVLVNYLSDMLDDDFQSKHKVIGFYDPMEWEDVSRVTVNAYQVESKLSGHGNYIATVDVGVKTSWTEQSLSYDVELHFSQLNCVRDLLSVESLSDAISNPSYAVPGLAITHAESVRRFITDLDRENHMYWSRTELQLHCHTTE